MDVFSEQSIRDNAALILIYAILATLLSTYLALKLAFDFDIIDFLIKSISQLIS